MKEVKAIVFDGNSLLNRAFYGVRPLSNSKGLPTNAVYGFLNILKNAMGEKEWTHGVVAFDVNVPTFRHKACDFYKATRKPSPEELRAQFPFAKQAAKALGLAVVELPGFEADDLLGTFSRLFTKDGGECFVTTGDRDSFQLVTDRVKVRYATDRETIVYGEQEIFEKYGVTPKQLIEVKSLMGDTSDNIPGVPGVGEKTALTLVAKYGDLDGVYAHLDEQKGALLAKLTDNKESAYTSRFLAEIKLDAPVDEDETKYEYRGPDREALRALYTELEFRKMLEQLDKESPAEAKPVSGTEFLPGDGSKIKKGVPLCAEPCGDGVKIFDGENAVLVDFEKAAELIKEAPETTYWAFKEAIAAFREKGIGLPDKGAKDLSLMAYLAALSDSAVTYEGVVFRVTGGNPTGGVDPGLFPVLEAFLREKLTEKQKKLYEEVEFPLTKVLADMEGRGFLLDREALEAMGERLSKEASELEQAIYQTAGREFNINSPAQLGDLLFVERGLPHGKKLKSGKYSTDAEILEKVADIDPLVQMILDYRKLSKLQNTYIEGLKKEISDDGRVHTTFRQTLTMTGRLSSAEPNLQNIPVRTERGRELRRLFVAPQGCKLIDADYSQIELRLMAHVSGDENLINAFLQGEDIHRSTAASVFGVDEQSVTDEMRKFAKTINFGILYGMSDFSLSQDLKIPLWKAKEYIAAYFARFPKVKAYLEQTVAFAAENGYAETMYGRRREIPEIRQSNKMRRAAAERVAMNTPIQGAAADLIKIAMVNVSRALAEAGLKAKLVLQIHDELIVEAPDREVERASEILQREMQGAADLSVPLSVETGVGQSWEM